jgi:hypothetical protein
MSFARAGRARLIAVIGVTALFVLVLGGYGLGWFRSPGNGCRVRGGVPSCGAWWGAALDTRDSALPGAVRGTEASTGRRLDIVHTYHRWQDAFPTSGERELVSGGRLLFANWEPVLPDGAGVSWADIAAGRQDRTIRSEAARLAALHRPVLISFSHEPELNYRSHGAVGDYAAAFRHVVTVSRQAGATQVRWVWDLMGLSDPVWQARYVTMWPGAAYVDWIAWDPYNAASCKQRAWQSFAQTVTPFYDWLDGQPFAAGKPLMLAEYGTIEGSAQDGKAGWLAAIPAALTRLPRLRALLYFDLPAPPANCDWLVTTSASATRAFGKLARSKAFSWPSSRNPAQS